MQLDRVQAGTGGLVCEIHAAQPGTTAVLLECDGIPSQSVLVGGQAGFAPSVSRPLVALSENRLTVDLGAGPGLRRFAVVLQEAGDEGAVVLRTLDGARVEVPLQAEGTGDATVVLTGVRVGGGLVLRAQGRRVQDGLRGAAAAFGFHDITWQNSVTAVAD